MNIKIRSIILWPKNPQNEIRRIDFKCKGVEVISGWSEKGKSSIIHIIDYCLGSEKCAIPIGKVRETVEWFGILLALPNGKQILSARLNPGESQENSDMMFVEGKRISIPDQPTKTHRRDTVISALDKLAKLPQRGAAEEEGSDSEGPPSFRDMAAFNFQPQNVVANPNILFFKSELWEHRRKLTRSVLPYVLGAVDAETLDYQSRYRIIETKLRLKREELDLKQRAMESLVAGLRSHFRTAQANELIPEGISPTVEWGPQDFVQHLREALKTWKSTPALSSLGSMTRKARAEVSALQKSQKILIREIDDLNRQISKTERVSESFGGYAESLKDQSARVFPAGWLHTYFTEHFACPICNGPQPRKGEFDRLVYVAKKLGETVQAVSQGAPVLTAEKRRLERLLDESENKLQAIDVQLNDWEKRSAELAELGSRRDFLNTFTGRLGSELDAIDAGGVTALENEVKSMERELRLLAVKINPERIRSKTEKALKSISKSIAHYARAMQVGHSSQEWVIDERNLTLVSHKPGRNDYLWEIGSAANWMGYHIATLLAMHEFFRTVPENPVPKFIVFDQPSQAYFPEGLGKKGGKKTQELIRTRSDDISRLKRLFLALSDAVTRTNGGLQIILLEHAEPEMWEGIPNFSLVENVEWRDRGALIPDSWK